jgi:hypothetical protein
VRAVNGTKVSFGEHASSITEILSHCPTVCASQVVRLGFLNAVLLCNFISESRNRQPLSVCPRSDLSPSSQMDDQ